MISVVDTAEIHRPVAAGRSFHRLERWSLFLSGLAAGAYIALATWSAGDELSVVLLDLARSAGIALTALLVAAIVARREGGRLVTHIDARIDRNRQAVIARDEQLARLVTMHEAEMVRMAAMEASQRRLIELLAYVAQDSRDIATQRAIEYSGQIDGMRVAMLEGLSRIQSEPRRRTRGRRSRRQVVGIDGEVQEAARTIARRLVHLPEHP